MTPIVLAGSAGWLHEPQSPEQGTRGALILGAHGFEGLCSARFVRRLASGLAAEGFCCLRFDLPGTGDSLGHDTDPGRWAAWQAAADAALAVLATRGLREVTVIGLRLGALLAGDLAARHGAGDIRVTSLALLAPPASGRAYAREQTALARLLAPADDPDTTQPDGLSVAGFPVTAQTLASLKTVAWTAPGAVRHVLLMPQAGAAEPLAGRFAGWGAQVTQKSFERYAAMMCDPTASRLAVEAIEAVLDWARALPADPKRPCASGPVEGAGARALIGPGWREERVRFGAGPQKLAAVLCEPDRGATDQPVTLILNAGAIPHVGWARAGVEQARALAGSGRASLRLDFCGMGDSDERPGEADPDLYGRDARLDVAAAFGFLRLRGYHRFVLAGTCGGAYQALHAALAEPAVEGLVLVNQLCYRWTPRQALGLALWARSKSALMEARRPGDAAPGRSWPARLPARLAARVLGTARPAVKAALALGGRVSSLLGTLFDPEDVEVAGWFSALDRRGVRMLAVASAGDPSLEEACRLFGPGGLSTLPGLRTLVLPDADHVLTQPAARRALADALLDMAGSTVQGAGGSGSRRPIQGGADGSMPVRLNPSGPGALRGSGQCSSGATLPRGRVQ